LIDEFVDESLVEICDGSWMNAEISISYLCPSKVSTEYVCFLRIKEISHPSTFRFFSRFLSKQDSSRLTLAEKTGGDSASGTIPLLLTGSDLRLSNGSSDYARICRGCPDKITGGSLAAVPEPISQKNSPLGR
jgi:hypothetical protein